MKCHKARYARASVLAQRSMAQGLS